jgi:hypothetical protein
MTPLDVKLRTAALADSNLPGILTGNSFTGTQAQFNGVFRWYDTQLFEGSPYPAVVVTDISPVPYQGQQRNPISKVRVQFLLWEGSTPDATGNYLSALLSFIDSFSGSTGRSLIVNDGSRGFYAATQPSIYQRIVEAYIFNNTTT